jgi:hypothetical protein
MTQSLAPWLVWIAGGSGLSLGFALGARRGGRAWMAAFWRGGEAGMRVTLDAFEDSAIHGKASVGPKDRLEALAQLEGEGRSR